MIRNVLFLVCGLLVSACSNTEFDLSTPRQAVASAHPIATQAGIDILNQGGNAFDAAVAISATLAVVEPAGSGMGGGGFWLLHLEKEQTDIMIDGRETAPLNAHRDMYLDQNGNVIEGLSINGPMSAGIPGQPAALVHINKRYGSLPLKTVLTPAIKAAQDGFKVSEHYQRMARFRQKIFNKYPAAAKIFLQDGKVPDKGFVIKQADLARTLNQIAEHGHDGFYKGDIAKAMVDGVREAGGIWTQDDLAAYKVIERKPIVGHYLDYKITSVAPPSSGGVALIGMLNILEDRNWSALAEIDRSHLLIEAMRRVYRDRAMFLGDSDFVAVPIPRLIDKHYAVQLANNINMKKATPSKELPGPESAPKAMHTTHFSVIDKQGNRVAATLSINYPFGSCFVPPGTGILLNDEMDDFSMKPGVPNAYGLVGAEANSIAPGKRMLSSMSPTFIEGKQRLAIIGTPGGSRIITMVLHGILAVTEGRTAEEIVSMPRFHHQYLPDEVQYEKGGFTTTQAAELIKRGHHLKQLNSTFGNMQLILIDKVKNTISAASDPRGEGLAVVQ